MGKWPERCAALTVPIVCAACFLDLLQLSAMIFAIPDIGRALGVTLSDLNWVLVAYSIGFGSSLLMAGRLSDLFGVRRVFVSGLFLLCAFNAWCAWSPSREMLIVGRALAGVAAALTTPTAMAAISKVLPAGPRQSAGFAAYAIAGPLGSIIGLVVGGGLTKSSVGWRSVFWVCLILSSLILVFAVAFLPKIPAAPRSITLVKAMDLPGTVLSTAALALIIYALNAAAANRWSSPQIVAPLVIGLATVPGFVLWEKKYAGNHALIPDYMWRSGSMGTLLATTVLFAGALSTFMYLATEICLQVAHYSPLRSALYFLPIAGCAVLSGIASQLLLKVVHQKLVVLAGLLVSAGGLVAWALYRPSRGPWYVIVFGMLFVFGNPPTVVPVQVNILNLAAREDRGLAGALFNIAYQVGAGLLLSVANAIAARNDPSATPDGSAAQLTGYRNGMWLLFAAQLLAFGLVAVFWWPARALPSDDTEHVSAKQAEAKPPMTDTPTSEKEQDEMSEPVQLYNDPRF